MKIVEIEFIIDASDETIAAATIGFRVSADADQFLTMARLRAARTLWRSVLAACGVGGDVDEDGVWDCEDGCLDGDRDDAPVDSHGVRTGTVG